MKLSEAILLGSLLSKQGYGWSAMSGERRCALGAALAAIGYTPCPDRPSRVFALYDVISNRWPWVNTTRAACPLFELGGCGVVFGQNYGQDSTPLVIILHLNDHHYWTLLRIVRWVMSVEPTGDGLARSLTLGSAQVAMEAV